MSTRPILIVIVLLLAIGSSLTGCGPGTTGIKAREAARERLSFINAQFTYDQAMQAFEVGQFDHALRGINAAIELVPESADFYVLQGRIYLETHRLEKAIDSFTSALEHQSDFTDAHYFAGIVYQRWSDDDKAYEHYMAAYELEPSSIGYLLAAAESMIAMERLDQAKQLILSKLAYFEHNASLRHLLGQIALLQGDAATAAKLLAEAWRRNPDDQMLLEELAHAQSAAGMHAKCYKSVKQLQQMSREKRPDLIHLEARCLFSMERLIEARKVYLALTRLTPTDPEVWIELGTLAWELGDFHRLAQCGARVTALAPQRYEGYMLKGINERHRGDVRKASRLLRQATDRAGETALPYLVLGRTLEETGDREGALDAYTAGVRVEPDNANARVLLARLSRNEQVMTFQPQEQIRTE